MLAKHFHMEAPLTVCGQGRFFASYQLNISLRRYVEYAAGGDAQGGDHR